MFIMAEFGITAESLAALEETPPAAEAPVGQDPVEVVADGGADAETPQAAVVAAPAAEPEPEWIEVTDEEGRPYTRVERSRVPELIRTKDANYRRLQAEADYWRQQASGGPAGPSAAAQPAQPAEAAAAAANPKRVARVKALIRESGLPEDEGFAAVLGQVLDDAVGEAVETIRAQGEQQAAQQWNQDYWDLAGRDPSFDIRVPENEAARMAMSYAALNRIPPNEAYQKFLALTGRGSPRPAAPELAPGTAAAVDARVAAAARPAGVAPGGGAPVASGGVRLGPQGQAALDLYRQHNPDATEADIRWATNYAASRYDRR